MAMELYVPARGGPGTSHGIVKDIHEDIKHEYAELMNYCGTKNWEDTKLVLSKVVDFNQKGLNFNYGE